MIACLKQFIVFCDISLWNVLMLNDGPRGFLVAYSDFTSQTCSISHLDSHGLHLKNCVFFAQSKKLRPLCLFSSVLSNLTHIKKIVYITLHIKRLEKRAEIFVSGRGGEGEYILQLCIYLIKNSSLLPFQEIQILLLTLPELHLIDDFSVSETSHMLLVRAQNWFSVLAYIRHL